MATFGNTTEYTYPYAFYSSVIQLQKFTLSEAGTVTDIRAYCYHDGLGDMSLAVYSDGDPNLTLKGESSAFQISGTVSWNTASGLSISLSAGDYWLAIQYEGASFNFMTTSSGSGEPHYIARTWGAFPATLSLAGLSAGAVSNAAIYATYTAGGGATNVSYMIFES